MTQIEPARIDPALRHVTGADASAPLLSSEAIRWRGTRRPDTIKGVAVRGLGIDVAPVVTSARGAS